MKSITLRVLCEGQTELNGNAISIPPASAVRDTKLQRAKPVAVLDKQT